MADANIRAVITADDKASSVLKNFSSNIHTSAKSASDAFGGIARGIEQVAMRAAITLAGSGGIGALFVKSAADLQQTSKSFEVLTGNVDTANKLFSQLAKYANNTPFEFPQIAKAGQTLLGFGIQSDKVFDNIKMLGDIAAATGADMSSLALVFGQVNATGKLMGQDALQLINNRIPITSILAKKLGTNVQEVRKKMEEGSISAQLFNDALAETTKAGGFAFKGTDILAQSFNGRLSTLKDTVLEFGRNLLGVKVDPELGLTVKPGGIFDRLSQTLPKIGDSLAKMTPRIEAAFDFLMRNGSTIKALLAGIAAGYIAAKIAAIGFAIAAAINPFTLIAAAIVALIAAVVFLQVKFGLFTTIWQALQTAWDAVSNAISTGLQWIGDKASWLKDHFWEVIGGIIGFFATLPIMLPFYIAQAIAKIVGFLMSLKWSDIFSGIWQAMQGVWDKITNIVVRAWQFIHDIKWSDLFIGIGKSIANVLLALIEGAVKGALRGLPGNIEKNFNLPRFAGGTDYAPGGTAIVGERGPELVNLPRGSQVIANNKLGGTSTPAVNVTFNGIFTGNEMEFRKLAVKLNQALGDAQGMGTI